MKRGQGEYEPAENNLLISNKPSVVNLRNHFLSVVREHNKDVLVALSKEPLEAFIAASPGFDSPLRAHLEGEFIYLILKDEPIDNYPGFPTPERALCEAVRQWSNTYHLRDEWCLRVAFRTLEKWQNNTSLLNKLQWDYEV